VAAWVGWLVDRGMLERVMGPTGKRGLRSRTFADYQPGARLERERRSPYEPPEVTAAFKELDTRGRSSQRKKSVMSPDQVRTRSGRVRTWSAEEKSSQVKDLTSLTTPQDATPAPGGGAGAPGDDGREDEPLPLGSDQAIDAARQVLAQVAKARRMPATDDHDGGAR
jgi:hypothetical protein